MIIKTIQFLAGILIILLVAFAPLFGWYTSSGPDSLMYKYLPVFPNDIIHFSCAFVIFIEIVIGAVMIAIGGYSLVGMATKKKEDLTNGLQVAPREEKSENS